MYRNWRNKLKIRIPVVLKYQRKKKIRKQFYVLVENLKSVLNFFSLSHKGKKKKYCFS